MPAAVERARLLVLCPAVLDGLWWRVAGHVRVRAVRVHWGMGEVPQVPRLHVRHQRDVPGGLPDARHLRVRDVQVQHWVERAVVQLLDGAVPRQLQRARHVHLRRVRVRGGLDGLLLRL